MVGQGSLAESHKIVASKRVVALTAACVVNPSPEFTLHIPGHDTVEVQLWSEGGWFGRGF
jgi:hypothetical protein